MALSGNLIVPQCGYAEMRSEIAAWLPKAQSDRIFGSIVRHNFETFKIRNVLPLALEIQLQLRKLLKEIACSEDTRIVKYHRALVYNYLQSVNEA